MIIFNSIIFLLHLIHHVDHFAKVIREIRCLSKDAKEKAAQATRRADDAHLSRLKIEDENRSLKEEVKRLESELAKARCDAETQLLAEKKTCKEQIEVAKVEAVEAIHSSAEFHDIKWNLP